MAEEASPDSKCPICLDRFNNLAYLDRCLHRFCFPCIQEWSHNKAECPLCKQPFTSILHSVRAEDDFKEYTLRPPPSNGSVAATVAMVAAMATAARSDHEMRLLLRRRAQEGGETAGAIFEGLTGLGGAVVPVAPNDRSSRRLMTRLAARRRLQREGGAVRRLREREMLAFRRALYRSGVRVNGVAGANGSQGQQQQQREVTAESFCRNLTHLSRLRPWLRRELTVLYGAHGSLVDIVQRIITARLARHGLEDTPTIEEELRPFLLARTDHFLHELVSFARSPLSLENYDLQAVYDPPATPMDLEHSSTTDTDSVIAISEGEEEQEGGGGGGGGLEEGGYKDVIQTGSSLSLSAWDDETPGPSYTTAEPSHSPALLSVHPGTQEGANEEAGEGEEGEEECLIVGYMKPMAERTPELVQLSSDTEEEQEMTESLPPLPSVVPPVPPSTSSAGREERQTDTLTDTHAQREGSAHSLRARSWSRARSRSCSGSCSGSGSGQNTVCMLSPVSLTHTPPGERATSHSNYPESSGCETERERVAASYNPNRSIYPAMFRRLEFRHSQSPSPFRSSTDSLSRSQSPASPLDSPWEYHRSDPSSSSASPLSPGICGNAGGHGDLHHGDKPGGKRKYKSRHLDDDRDPTWQPRSGRHGDKRRERGGEKEKGEKRRRHGGKRRERGRKEGHCEKSVGEEDRSRSRRRCRESRSPSVEIIYEGTVSSSAAPHTPANKRRRPPHRKPQPSSSPVVITIDSDSSHDGGQNNNSSSPGLSNQRPIFKRRSKELPPLSLVVPGGNLGADITELPVDILERGSDSSDAEREDQSKTADPFTLDNSDDGDGDVDVENDEDDVCNILADGERETQAGTIERDLRQGERGARDRKRDAGVATPDTRLLATILNDLEGVAGPTPDLPLTFDPKHSGDPGKGHFRGDSDPDQVLHPDPSLNYDPNRTSQSREADAPSPSATHRTTSPPPPPLRQFKERRVREEETDREIPLVLKPRDRPPPLKHKDTRRPKLSPVCPSDSQSTPSQSRGLVSTVDLRSPGPAESRSSGWVCSDRWTVVDGSSSAHSAAINFHSSSPPAETHPTCGAPPTGRTSCAAGRKETPASNQLTHLDFPCKQETPPGGHLSWGVSAKQNAVSSGVSSKADCNKSFSPMCLSTVSNSTSPPPRVHLHPSSQGCTRDRRSEREGSSSVRSEVKSAPSTGSPPNHLLQTSHPSASHLLSSGWAPDSLSESDGWSGVCFKARSVPGRPPPHSDLDCSSPASPVERDISPARCTEHTQTASNTTWPNAVTTHSFNHVSSHPSSHPSLCLTLPGDSSAPGLQLKDSDLSQPSSPKNHSTLFYSESILNTDPQCKPQLPIDSQCKPHHLIDPQCKPHHLIDPQCKPQLPIDPQCKPHHLIDPQCKPQLPIDPQCKPHHLIDPQCKPQLPIDPQCKPHHLIDPQCKPHHLIDPQCKPHHLIDPQCKPHHLIDPQCKPHHLIDPQCKPHHPIDPQCKPHHPIDPQCKPHHPIDPQCKPHHPIDPQCKPHHLIDPQCKPHHLIDSHLKSTQRDFRKSPSAIDEQLKIQSPIGGRSAGGPHKETEATSSVWNSHTQSTT
ncbi:uncharacterized protein ACJ7VT_012345 [Polymixia lowei]